MVSCPAFLAFQNGNPLSLSSYEMLDMEKSVGLISPSERKMLP